ELSLENNTQLAATPGLDSLTLHYSSGNFSQLTPGLDYSDPSKLYLGGIYGSGYGKTPKVEDELKSFRLSASFTAPGFAGSWFSGIDVGLNYADREKAQRQPEGNIH